MADKPYQKRVDEFLADYTDKFIPTLITGKGTKETPFTNMSGPEASPLTREQLDLEKTKILANSISPDIFTRVLDTMRGERAIPSHQVNLGTPMSEFSNSPEGQRIMRERAIPIPHVSTGFLPPTGGGTLEEIRSSIPNELAQGPGGGVIDMAQNKEGVFEKAIPSLESQWGIKREGNIFTLPGGEGTMTVGPERFFLGGKEVPAGTPGAVSGDQLARDRIEAESNAQRTAWGEEFAPVPRSYYEAHPEERYLDELSRRNTPIMDNILRAIAQNRQMLPGYGLSSDRTVGEIQRLGAGKRLQGLSEVLVTAGAIPGQTTAKFLENIGQGSQRQAMADYYNRMAGVHEAAIPSETFARYATGAHALSEAERPYAFPPNSAVYQGAKLLGYVPEKPEAIHPIILDIINKSELIDPNTGMKTGGFDIRGARQKIGYIAPWLGSRGIDVPKEAYKMTKPEFLGEQKSFIAKLPKKERNRYTKDYTEQLWKEYWGE